MDALLTREVQLLKEVLWLVQRWSGDGRAGAERRRRRRRRGAAAAEARERDAGAEAEAGAGKRERRWRRRLARPARPRRRRRRWRRPPARALSPPPAPPPPPSPPASTPAPASLPPRHAPSAPNDVPQEQEAMATAAAAATTTARQRSVSTTIGVSQGSSCMRAVVRHRSGGGDGSPRLPWPRARSPAAAARKGASAGAARRPHRCGAGARLVAALLLLHSASIVGCMPGGGGAATGAPENVTVIFFNATTVSVTWVAPDRADKYDVTYKPTDASYRVVALVAGNLRTVTLHNLSADTQYQLFVTAVRQGKKARSPTVVFNTAELPTAAPAPAPAPAPTQSEEPAPAPGPSGEVTPAASSSSSRGEAAAAAAAASGVTESIAGGGGGSGRGLHVRGVEVGIVLLVLVVWVAAIALFFNRWGKIRMLLPYQPDYKEQLKVPGSAATSGGVSCTGQHQGGQACPQHFHWAPHDPWAGRPSRPRVNSAIYISSATRDADFIRHHQSFPSNLCRRSRSAENIPLSGLREGLPILSVSQASPPDVQLEEEENL